MHLFTTNLCLVPTVKLAALLPVALYKNLQRTWVVFNWFIFIHISVNSHFDIYYIISLVKAGITISQACIKSGWFIHTDKMSKVTGPIIFFLWRLKICLNLISHVYILKYLKVQLDSHIFISSIYNLKTHVLLDNI